MLLPLVYFCDLILEIAELLVVNMKITCEPRSEIMFIALQSWIDLSDLSMEKLSPPLEPNLQVSDKYADELADTLLKLVHINDDQSIETDSDAEIQMNEIRSNGKCLIRYVSFPSPSKLISQSSSSDEEENCESVENLPSHQQVSCFVCGVLGSLLDPQGIVLMIKIRFC